MEGFEVLNRMPTMAALSNAQLQERIVVCKGMEGLGYDEVDCYVNLFWV